MDFFQLPIKFNGHADRRQDNAVNEFHRCDLRIGNSANFALLIYSLGPGSLQVFRENYGFCEAVDKIIWIY